MSTSTGLLVGVYVETSVDSREDAIDRDRITRDQAESALRTELILQVDIGSRFIGTIGADGAVRARSRSCCRVETLGAGNSVGESCG